MMRLMQLIVVLCLINAAGCATFINGSDDNVAFSSVPSGAAVSIDGIEMGMTPCVIPVKRKGGSKTVGFQYAGYKTVQYHLSSKMSGSVWGNVLLGGVVGVGVDAVSGRSNEFQDSVRVILERGYGSIVINAKQAKEEEKEREKKEKKEKKELEKRQKELEKQRK